MRQHVLGLKAGPTGFDRRLKRLVALLDVLDLKSVEAKRDALAALEVIVFRRVVNHQVVSVVRIRGTERQLWRRALRAVAPVALYQEAAEQPDGSAVASPVATRRTDPQTLEEAEEYADVEMAAAQAIEDEASGQYAEIEQWLGDSEAATCAAVPVPMREMPDGGELTPAMNSLDSCVSEAWGALSGLGGAILGAQSVKAAVASSLATLDTLVTGYMTSFAAGTITAEAMVSMVGGALVDFVATINIGWIAAGLVAAGAVYFAYEWYQCAYPNEPYEDHQLGAQGSLYWL